jgi:hypothetical protein
MHGHLHEKSGAHVVKNPRNSLQTPRIHTLRVLIVIHVILSRCLGSTINDIAYIVLSHLAQMFQDLLFEKKFHARA